MLLQLNDPNAAQGDIGLVRHLGMMNRSMDLRSQGCRHDLWHLVTTRYTEVAAAEPDAEVFAQVVCDVAASSSISGGKQLLCWGCQGPIFVPRSKYAAFLTAPIHARPAAQPSKPSAAPTAAAYGNFLPANHEALSEPPEEQAWAIQAAATAARRAGAMPAPALGRRATGQLPMLPMM